jgi:hypothetical protein
MPKLSCSAYLLQQGTIKIKMHQKIMYQHLIKQFITTLNILKKKKQTWFLAFHHLSGAKIVPSSALQPTPVSKINLFHILQYFLIPSHLFFNCAFVNAWPV